VTSQPQGTGARSNADDSVLVRTLREADRQLERLSCGTTAHAGQGVLPNALPAHVLLVDTQGRSISIDDSGRQLDCFNPLTDTHFSLLPEFRVVGGLPAVTGASQIERVAAGVRSVLTGAVPRYSCEYVSRTNLAERWYLVTVTPLNEAYPTGAVVMYLDITDRKHGELRSRIAYLNRVRAMLSRINTLIVHEHDRKNLMKRACRIAVEDGGLKLSMMALVDRPTMRFIPVGLASKDKKLLSAVKSALLAGGGSATTMIKQAMRDKRPVISNDSQHDPKVAFPKVHADFDVRSMAVFPLIIDNEVVGVLSLYADECQFFHQEEVKLLSELTNDVAFAIDHIEKQERLRYLAYYDELTGLANRTRFMERLTHMQLSATEAGQSFALLLIDLQGFRNINDSLGRPVGDALLKQVGEWLRYNVEDAKLLARVGVDHFAAVLPDLDPDDDLPTFIDRLLGSFVAHRFVLNGTEFRIAARIGVSRHPDDGNDADTLLKHAEAALKQAKACRDRFMFYNQKMTESVAGKLTLENRLHQALEKDQFVLYYQPKLHLASGRVTGVEALIRWNDPEAGLVLPERFIGILEETGMIREVGRWVLRKAVEDYLRWCSAGLDAVCIAVNVSPLQLRNHRFVREIEEVIAIDPRAAAGLELEITESLVMEDIRHNIESLRQVRAMGVSIAIDDFGTGFSSLSYLAKLPVHTLKIDRSFVTDMTAGPESIGLVSTIIKLAHSMNLNVVAEGVETDQQSHLLRLLKCDEIQGYLASMPMSRKNFEARHLAAPLSA
jgi:diguanylate cyclase (GGDEF)-like protein